MSKKISNSSGTKKFFIILGIFTAYLGFSVYQFGVANGVLVSTLSWTFFVFCTPIADAGFLLDFPIRLITGVRMLYTELMVWAIAVAINLITVLLMPEIYEKTALLQLFRQIITTPWPLGLIVVLSAAGTYLSVYLGDDAFDIATAKNKKNRLAHERNKLLFSVVAFSATIVLYATLLRFTHLSIKIL